MLNDSTIIDLRGFKLKNKRFEQTYQESKETLKRPLTWALTNEAD